MFETDPRPSTADATPRLSAPDRPFGAVADLDARRLKNSVAAKLFGRTPEVVKIGRFRVAGRLGSGGMGVVYEGRDDRLDRKVAIKVLHPSHHEDERRRMMREAQALARLSHANVLQIYEVGEHGSQVFIAMEFVDGGSLRDYRVRATTGAELRRTIEPWLQAARGLQAAHAAGLVHRDFKPDNVLIGSDRRVRVADFGLAVASGPLESRDDVRPHGHGGPVVDEASVDLGLDERDSAVSELGYSLTESGCLLGTPAYMSPEQHACQRVDARSDQFSFCIALYESILGSRPFRGANLAELAENVCDGRFHDPRALARLPRKLRVVLERGLASDPELRYPTMESLRKSLESAIGVGPWRSVSMVAAAALAAGFATWGVAADDPTVRCADASAREIEAHWNREVRGRMSSAFASVAAGFGNDVAAGAEVAIERYVVRWRSERARTCRVSEGEATSPRASDAITAASVGHELVCLGAAQAALGQLLARFVEPDGLTVRRAISVIEALPDPSACRANAEPSIEARPRDVDDPRYLEFESALARAELALAMRERERGPSLAQKAVELADALDIASARARSRRVWGELQVVLGDFDGALDDLADARRIAQPLGDVELRVRILHATIRALTATSDLRAARRVADDAALLMDGIDASPSLRAQASARLGHLARREGSMCEALQHFERTFQIRSRGARPDSLRVAKDRVNFGTSLMLVGRGEAARAEFESALAVFEEVVGSHHPDLAPMLVNLAILDSEHAIALAPGPERNAGLARAEARLRRALSVDEHSLHGLNLGEVLLRQGRFEASRREFERAKTAVERRFRGEHPMVFRAFLGLGESALAAGLAGDDHAMEDARRWLARVDGMLPGLGDAVSDEDRGIVAFAMAKLERARANPGPSSTHERVRTHLAQARAALSRAVELANEAMAEGSCATASEVRRRRRLLDELETWADLHGLAPNEKNE